MREEHLKIFKYLKTGAENAITKRRLALMVGMPTRKIEHLIREMIVEYGVEIGSSCHKPFGYFIIADEAESKRYEIQLLSRMRKLNERLRAANKNKARRIGEVLQQELF